MSLASQHRAAAAAAAAAAAPGGHRLAQKGRLAFREKELVDPDAQGAGARGLRRAERGGGGGGGGAQARQ